MKKFFSLMVIAAMCVSFVGCGDTKPKPAPAPTDKPADTPAK
jgi:predicted small lipoprotein YifL